MFKEKPGLCAAIYALAHNKESSASAEKPAAETGTIIGAPIEVKKGPTMGENNASATLTGELHIKKPATSSNPVSENCLKTETKSGESLCLTKGTLAPASTPNKEAEKPVPELNCNKPAWTKNGMASAYRNGPFYEPC
ncbi:MAG: hypothetical protein WAM14_12095 [Candidatus Nitrosopolaris sp.]